MIIYQNGLAITEYSKKTLSRNWHWLNHKRAAINYKRNIIRVIMTCHLSTLPTICSIVCHIVKFWQPTGRRKLIYPVTENFTNLSKDHRWDAIIYYTFCSTSYCGFENVSPKITQTVGIWSLISPQLKFYCITGLTLFEPKSWIICNKIVNFWTHWSSKTQGQARARGDKYTIKC